jgi:hypothetical protein
VVEDALAHRIVGLNAVLTRGKAQNQEQNGSKSHLSIITGSGRKQSRSSRDREGAVSVPRMFLRGQELDYPDARASY